MKAAMWGGITVLLVLATAATAADPGAYNAPQPNINNPAGMGGVPPSVYTPASRVGRDIYAGGGQGNLIVTGDVSGGRQFRGVVPYSSVSSLSTPAGTVDDFLRNTAGSPYGTAPGAVQPYYIPTRAVTNLPGGGGVGLQKVSLKASGGKNEFVTPTETKPSEPSLMELSQQYRPLSRTPQEMADLISKQLPASETETQLLKAINDVRQKELLDELEKIKQRAGKLIEEEPGTKPEEISPAAKNAIDKPVEPLSPEKVGTQAGEQTPSGKPADIYDKMLQQLDKDFEDYMKGRQLKTEDAAAATAAEKSKEQAAGMAESGQPTAVPKPASSAELRERTRRLSIEREGLETALSQSREAGGPKLEEIQAKGYKLYMDLAAEYMKQAKFYRAADTYAIARIYKEDKAESYAGQGVALFATGEYMSSAYYIGRAIEMDPNTAAKHVDLAGLIGADRLSARVADLEKWQKMSYSAEMQFLLAYIYYETGKKIDAEDEVRGAAVKMEGYRPAAILKGIITGTLK
jgi:hypothetical protein